MEAVPLPDLTVKEIGAVPLPDLTAKEKGRIKTKIKNKIKQPEMRTQRAVGISAQTGKTAKRWKIGWKKPANGTAIVRISGCQGLINVK